MQNHGLKKRGAEGENEKDETSKIPLFQREGSKRKEI